MLHKEAFLIEEKKHELMTKNTGCLRMQEISGLRSQI